MEIPMASLFLVFYPTPTLPLHDNVPPPIHDNVKYDKGKDECIRITDTYAPTVVRTERSFLPLSPTPTHTYSLIHICPGNYL